MEEPSSEFALTRIDAALARLEAIAARPRTSINTDTNASDLAQRHERLCAAVAETLRDLDGLMAEQ